MTTLAPNLAALDAAAAWAWLAGELATAAGSARHGLHLLTVATVSDDGPSARTVVLRHFDAGRRELRFHTDVRSPKVAAVRGRSAVALHWYDPATRMQLVIPAIATVHHDDAITAAAWAAALPMSRACYTTAHPPGSPLAEFSPAATPPDAGDDTGRSRFAVVSCRFATVELLCLHAAGHQRVRLHLDRTPVTWDVLAP